MVTVLRVKRKRCEEPLDSLVIERIAKRANKRPAVGALLGNRATSTDPEREALRDGRAASLEALGVEVDVDEGGSDRGGAPESPRLAVLCRVETVDAADAGRPSTNRRVLRKIKRRIASGGSSSQRWHAARHPTSSIEVSGGGRASAQSARARGASRAAHSGRIAGARQRSVQQRRQLASPNATATAGADEHDEAADGEGERVTFVDFVAPSAEAPRSPARDIPGAARGAVAAPPPHGGSWGSASGGGGSATVHGLLASYDVALTEVEAQMDAAVCTALDSANFAAVFHCITVLGASVNYVRRHGDDCTALIAAAACGDCAVARHLIEMGADVMHCDRSGRSALSLARDQANAELLEIIRTAVRSQFSRRRGASRRLPPRVRTRLVRVDRHPAPRRLELSAICLRVALEHYSYAIRLRRASSASSRSLRRSLAPLVAHPLRTLVWRHQQPRARVRRLRVRERNERSQRIGVDRGR
jgi:hypothetical protein